MREMQPLTIPILTLNTMTRWVSAPVAANSGLVSYFSVLKSERNPVRVTPF